MTQRYSRHSDVALEVFDDALAWWLRKQHFIPSLQFGVERSSEWFIDVRVRPDTDGTARITLTDGCGLAIYDATMSLAASSEFYPNIPVDMKKVYLAHPIYLAKWRRSRYFDYSWARKLENHPHVIGSAFVPKRFTVEDSRLRVMNHCYEMVMEVLLGHEKAHAVLGHLDSHESYGISETRYAGNMRSQAKGGLTRLRREELDADNAALHWLCNAGRDEQYRKTAHMECLKTVIDWDILVLLAAGILFSIIERCERQSKIDPKRRTHPSAAARMLNSVYCYRDMILTGEISLDKREAETSFSTFWWEYLSGLSTVGTLIGVVPLKLRDLQGSILTGSGLPPSPVAAELARLVRRGRPSKGNHRFPLTVPESFIVASRKIDSHR